MGPAGPGPRRPACGPFGCRPRRRVACQGCEGGSDPPATEHLQDLPWPYPRRRPPRPRPGAAGPRPGALTPLRAVSVPAVGRPSSPMWSAPAAVGTRAARPLTWTERARGGHRPDPCAPASLPGDPPVARCTALPCLRLAGSGGRQASIARPGCLLQEAHGPAGGPPGPNHDHATRSSGGCRAGRNPR